MNTNPGGYNPYSYNNYNSPYMKPKQKPSSVAALVFGILSTLCCCFAYAGAVFGVIAVILAVSSRRESGKFDTLSTVGLILGIFGAAISILTIISLYIVPEDVFNQYFEEYYSQFSGTSAYPEL